MASVLMSKYVLMTKFDILSLLKLKVLFLSLFLGLLLTGCKEAQIPEIITQPKSKIATANTQATLFVKAQISDGGVLAYQWYSNTKNSTDGGIAIEGANSDVFTFTVPSEGFAYYYVVITNVNANLTSYANVTSDVAVITVVDYDVFEVSFYDKNLKLVNIETVKFGEEIDLAEQKISWYLLDSAAAVGKFVVRTATAFFEVAIVRSIKDRADLEAIRYNLRGKYVLRADIDLSDSDWTPIGSKEEPFTGVLMGLGKAYTIKGLTINKPSTDCVGLFGHVKGAHIAAVKLELGEKGITGKDGVGSIAGCISSSTITSVSAKGYIKGNNYVGGIVGDIGFFSTVAAASAEGYIEGSRYVGGITGLIELGTVFFATSSVDIITGSCAGGIAGKAGLSSIILSTVYGKVARSIIACDYPLTPYFNIIVASYFRGEATQ
jgi:hypothetical protein